MRVRSGVCLLAVGMLLRLPFASAQTPAPKGRIEGVVLQGGGASPQPVAGARVGVVKVSGTTGQNLIVPGRMVGTSITGGDSTPFPGMPAAGQRGGPGPAGPPPPPSGPMALPIPIVTTERDGRFVVPNLDEGSYRISVQQNGYVRQDYGQRVFPGQGTLINLAAGQVLRDITISLTPTGNLGGRIVDGEGRPGVGVPLQLLRAIYSQNGQRILQGAGNARTNDRGEYRFYWVTPGRYYLLGGSSAATTGIGGGNASPNEAGDSYAFTYYPGATDINRATPIEIRSGNELALDFVIPKQQFYSISGKVTTDPLNVANGNATLPPVTLSLAFQTLNGNNGVFTVGQGFDAATGTFTIRDVVPGSYVLQAAAPPSSARVPIEVTNTDIENLVVVVDSGVNINGRFVVEGGEMPAANSMRVQMRLMTNGLQNFVGFAPSAQPAADGSFSLPGVLPAQYRAIVPPSQDFYVKEIRYERADALNNPIEVSRRNSENATMEILISLNVGQVDGLIVDEKMQPVPGVQAVLVPDGNRSRPELYRNATTDQTGRFTIRGVTPGDYKLFSWEALENNGYFDPDVMRRSEALGKPVRVGESSKLFVEGKIIPAGQ
jgi:hypothetical protein